MSLEGPLATSVLVDAPRELHNQILDDTINVGRVTERLFSPLQL
jgi:hypothetical protein